MTSPTIGRIVHYVSYGTPGGEYGSECRAAIITGVTEDMDGSEIVQVTVFNPTGLFFNTCVQSENAHRGGTWHWPERS